MRKLALAGVVCAVALAAFSGEANAFVGGGRSPSTAPLISWGQHYIGELSNRAEDANYSGSEQVAFYRLPPVSTHDLLTVDWHALPFTHDNGDFPVRMILAQGLNDYNWGPEFSSAAFDEGYYALSGSGTAQTTITVGNSDTATYVEFYANATAEEQKNFESYPYDFSVEAPRHYLTLNFPGVETVAANGQLHASVTNAVGQPAPDGLVYTLTANWQNNGVWIGTAASAGGQLTFQLALPEAAWNKSVRFIVSRPPDAEFQAVEAPAIRSKVTTPVAPAPSAACTEATARAHTLARQRRRLQAHMHRARGRAKHRLRHRVGHVTRSWHAAQAAAKSACA
jgi:hypothetical protein